MKTASAWCAALAAADEEHSQRAIANYLRRADRPQLSIGQIVDLLLRWHAAVGPPPQDLAVEAFTAAFDHPDLSLDIQVEWETLSTLSRCVLGWSVSMPNADDGKGQVPGYRALSRAAAAGLRSSVAAAVPLPVAAHAACVALHSCQYLLAAQALSVVGAHIADTERGCVSPSFVRFLGQGRAHLSALTDAHRSPSLAWELSVMNQASAGVS